MGNINEPALQSAKDQAGKGSDHYAGLFQSASYA